MAPPQVARADSIVGQAVKGNLLHVKIPIKQEPSPIYNEKGEKDRKGQA